MYKITEKRLNGDTQTMSIPTLWLWESWASEMTWCFDISFFNFLLCCRAYIDVFAEILKLWISCTTRGKQHMFFKLCVILYSSDNTIMDGKKLSWPRHLKVIAYSSPAMKPWSLLYKLWLRRNPIILLKTLVWLREQLFVRNGKHSTHPSYNCVQCYV